MDAQLCQTHVIAPDGTLPRVIERDCEPLARSREERQRVHDTYATALGAQFGSGAAADSVEEEATPQEVIGDRIP